MDSKLKSVTVTLKEDGDIEISVPEGVDIPIGDVILLLSLGSTKANMAYFANRLEVTRKPS